MLAVSQLARSGRAPFVYGAAVAAFAAWLVTVALGTVWLQKLAAQRTFETDPACLAGTRLSVVAEPGACTLVAVAVGGGERLSAGNRQLSLKYPDGVRGELAVSERAFRRFRKPGTTAFVQFYAGRISRFGDLAYAEATPSEPSSATRAAGRRAALAAATALCLTALAGLAHAVRGRGLRPRGATQSRANDGA